MNEIRKVTIRVTNWIHIMINTASFYFSDLRGLALHKIKARIEHKCSICHGIIEPGDHYCKIKGTISLCRRCLAMFPALLRDSVQGELDVLFNRLEQETLDFLQDAEWRPNTPMPEDLVS